MSSASPNVECARAVTCQRPVMPGGDEEALEMVRREVLGLVRDARARPDERHVAAEHVDQLRQLVEARLPQPATEARDRVAVVELVEAVRLDGGRSRSSCGLMDSRCASSSVPTCIVRNFSAVNSRMPARAASAGRTPGPASRA